MYLKLRVFFTILAVICVGAMLPIGSIFGFGWAGLCVVLACLFFGLMWLSKQNQELEERKKQREEEKKQEEALKKEEEKTE